MQTREDDDGTIPEFDFSNAQLARHRVRAGLETAEQYEERRALINSDIAKTGARKIPGPITIAIKESN